MNGQSLFLMDRGNLTRTERIFVWQLEHRAIMLLLIVLLTVFFGYFGSRIGPDHSVEHLFPAWSESREVYDRYKEAFPHEDSQAYIIVQAPDLYTREGLARIQSLEEAVYKLPHVLDIQGPMSIREIVDDGMLGTVPLFPTPDLDDAEIQRLKTIATTDPLFRWNLAKPDGSAISIRLTLNPDAVSEDAGRQEYHDAARSLIEEHRHESQIIVLSGLPSIRATFAGDVGKDLAVLVPAALFVVVMLLFFVYRSVGTCLACLITIVVSLIWAQGFQGIFGFPITILASILPIIVIVISVSDTAHIVNDYFARRREGKERKESLTDACARAAWPCLATETVIAGGFLSLLAVNIVAVFQFAIAAAGAMMLTWLANMMVMPLAMSFVKTDGTVAGKDGRVQPSFAIRCFARVIEFMATQVTTRPNRVLLIAASIALISIVAVTRIEPLGFVFDDLRPGSQFYQELRFAEQAHGGLVPIAIFVESLEDEDNAVLDPEIIRLMDRAGRLLRSFPEFSQAISVADILRKANRLFVGSEEGMLEPDELPGTRALAAQEVLLIDDGVILRDFISFDRQAAAAVGFGLDAGSQRFSEMFRVIHDWIDREQRRFDEDTTLPSVRISVTGQMQLFQEVNSTLTGGLVGSLGGAILITLLMFFIVFRSAALGFIGLVPNIMPILLVAAFMAMAGITLRPMTVIVFSIVLVIAYDDTVQYLARLRRNYADAIKRMGQRDPDELRRVAVIDTLWETGLPLFITSVIVSVGFLLLLFSRFEGVAHIGMILGVTLFFAFFADLFLAPILVEKVKPRLGSKNEECVPTDDAKSDDRPETTCAPRCR